MPNSPFVNLAPYSDKIRVHFLSKSDAITSDQDLAAALESDQLCTLKQVHGAHTVAVSAPELRAQEADGMLTVQPQLWLSIRVADCQSFVFYAPRRHAGGLLHVGWRGLVGGAIPAFLQAMQRAHGIPPEELLVGAAPSLCVDCAGFTDPTKELPSIHTRFVNGRHVNLQAAADQQLFDWGIKNGHLERSPDCTRCKHDTYWSYREEPDAVKQGNHNVLAMMLR